MGAQPNWDHKLPKPVAFIFCKYRLVLYGIVSSKIIQAHKTSSSDENLKPKSESKPMTLHGHEAESLCRPVVFWFISNSIALTEIPAVTQYNIRTVVVVQK